MRQADTGFLITGLRVDSVLKVNRMMTVTHALILRESWERYRANICVVLKNAFARCFGFDRMHTQGHRTSKNRPSPLEPFNLHLAPVFCLAP